MDDHLAEKIRIRAYELFLQREGRNGSDEHDWLAAEKEITQDKYKNAKKSRPAGRNVSAMHGLHAGG
jgi:hypothetical protein